MATSPDHTRDTRRHLSPQRWATGLSSVWEAGLLVVGADGVVDFANDAACALLNVDTLDDAQRSYASLAPQLADALKQSEGMLAAPTSGVAARERVQRTVRVEPRGTELRVEVYAIREDDCLGYLLLLQSSTRSAAVDRALRHAVKHRAMMSLSRDMAHNLKDMLNAISMNVELLSRFGTRPTLGEDERQRAARCADVVRLELKRLDRTLDGLLDRGLTDRETPQSFDLRALCDAVLLLVGARADAQHVTTHVAVPEGAIMIEGFPERIHVALLALIVNALDAMPNGGLLNVALERAPTPAVRVTDSGPGVPPEHVSRIWQPYFTTKVGGTGIGLSVAKTIVEAHGGLVRYEPNPEGGSVFVVELPAS